jgi:glycosyltransferase involved in cell wall biosynthesis
VPTVAFLTRDLQIGGAEVLLRDFLGTARAVGGPGCAYRVYPLRGGGPVEEELRKLDIPVRGLHGRIPFDPGAAVRLARCLRADRVDLLHCHLPEAGVVGRIACRLARIPVVYTEHSLWDHHHPVARALNRATLAWNDRVIAVSEAVRRCVLAGSRTPPDRVVTIPNGIDVARVERDAASAPAPWKTEGIADGTRIVGTVGSLAPVKGHRYLLHALAHLRARGHQVHGVIVGRDRGELPRLRRLAVDLGLEGCVTFAGQRADAAALIRAFDVFVLPSLSEGLPVTLLEAMALGRPVVATDVGGIPEVLRDGQDGLVVPAGDPAALAAGIDALLRDPERASRLGRTARERVLDEYTVRRMVVRYQQVHREVLGYT